MTDLVVRIVFSVLQKTCVRHINGRCFEPDKPCSDDCNIETCPLIEKKNGD